MGGSVGYRMKAMYKGNCVKCDSRIWPGDRIVFLPAICPPAYDPYYQANGITFHEGCSPNITVVERQYGRRRR